MRFGLAVVALLSALALNAATADNAPFLLPPGEFRVIDLHVPQTPLRVDAAFRVAENPTAPGSNAVHMELMPRPALRAMLRGMPHQALAATPEGASGSFRIVVEDAGAYRLVIKNRSSAAPAMVVLNLSTDLNADVIATELSPQRRIVVIGISFLLFFAMVGYSGWQLRKSAMD